VAEHANGFGGSPKFFNRFRRIEAQIRDSLKALGLAPCLPRLVIR
jgi:hypothetical protein